jgi:hypothetical protein
MTKGERLGEHVSELIKDNHLSDLLIRQIATAVSRLASYYQIDFFDVIACELNIKQLRKIKPISDLIDVKILMEFLSSYCLIDRHVRVELNKWVVANGGTEVPEPKRIRHNNKTNLVKGKYEYEYDYFKSNKYDYNYRTF